jgi:hypothetical protein
MNAKALRHIRMPYVKREMPIFREAVLCILEHPPHYSVELTLFKNIRDVNTTKAVFT